MKRKEGKKLSIGPEDRVRVKKSKHSASFLQPNNRVGAVVILAIGAQAAYLRMDKRVIKDPWNDPAEIIPDGFCYLARLRELKKIKR